jgi:hypothetical protein
MLQLVSGGLGLAWLNRRRTPRKGKDTKRETRDRQNLPGGDVHWGSPLGQDSIEGLVEESTSVETRSRIETRCHGCFRH